ncbi:MAG: methyltetrahydrofolate--corrinoid methyltransferase [Firmicutes bacterium HGW-Firmicutes-10]|jgi:5-methyltetrahydrofolate--homocysteine methyltransferase|nr:MAG: methyltetrahydrofolate--corrinoid methyltransferase [Firmicutes bacterium HGW-Firmicutes-10]
MIIIGEKLNSTLKSIRPAMESRDKEAIQDLARRQVRAGADFIDVNAGMFYENESEVLQWLIETIQEVTDTPFAIDSPSAMAILTGLKANKNGKPIINSITAEKARYDALIPLIKQFDTKVIALCMDDSGMPETSEKRVDIARTLIKNLTTVGVAMDDIFIDPMVRPVATGSHYGIVAIETIRQIKSEFPEVHIACGLSNISFGLPARKILNQSFLVAAMAAGMDGAIVDPLDRKLMSFVYASEALLGKDDYCMEFLTKFREGEIEV